MIFRLLQVTLAITSELHSEKGAILKPNKCQLHQQHFCLLDYIRNPPRIKFPARINSTLNADKKRYIFLLYLHIIHIYIFFFFLILQLQRKKTGYRFIICFEMSQQYFFPLKNVQIFFRSFESQIQSTFLRPPSAVKAPNLKGKSSVFLGD